LRLGERYTSGTRPRARESGGGGSGGLGAGGDIFVQAGASLTLTGDGSVSGSVAGGGHGPGAGYGLALGSALYFEGDQTVAIDTAGTQTIAGIYDNEGASVYTNWYRDSGVPFGYVPGSVALVLGGTGRVVLSASSAYTGGTTINAGTLELAAAHAAGFGPITFGGAPASLVVDAGTSLLLLGITTPTDIYGTTSLSAPGGTAVGIGGPGDSVIKSDTRP
jgi:autotransporter-associated beta strand protein